MIEVDFCPLQCPLTLWCSWSFTDTILGGLLWPSIEENSRVPYWTDWKANIWAKNTNRSIKNTPFDYSRARGSYGRIISQNGRRMMQNGWTQDDVGICRRQLGSAADHVTHNTRDFIKRRLASRGWLPGLMRVSSGTRETADDWSLCPSHEVEWRNRGLDLNLSGRQLFSQMEADSCSSSFQVSFYYCHPSSHLVALCQHFILYFWLLVVSPGSKG